jgi:hypothetical protein
MFAVVIKREQVPLEQAHQCLLLQDGLTLCKGKHKIDSFFILFFSYIRAFTSSQIYETMNKSPLMKKVLNLFKKTHETTDEQPAYPAALERTYRISKKVLGVGSFAVVKECIHKQSGTPYALKIILKKAIAGKLPCLLWHSFFMRRGTFF